MTIGESTGFIRLTPTKDQIMLQRVVVNVSDGIDRTTISFVIDVSEGSEPSRTPIFAFVAVGIVLLFLIIIGVVLLVVLKRRKKGEGDEGDRLDRESDLENGPKKVKTDVAITVAEAHANLGKGSKPVSYEDLYGVAAPQKEEGMTTKELKDYISGQIQELEKKEE